MVKCFSPKYRLVRACVCVCLCESIQYCILHDLIDCLFVHVVHHLTFVDLSAFAIHDKWIGESAQVDNARLCSVSKLNPTQMQ